MIILRRRKRKRFITIDMEMGMGNLIKIEGDIKRYKHMMAELNHIPNISVEGFLERLKNGEHI